MPGGLTTAEIAGWTGHVLSGPRPDLADVLRRPEAQRNGAYLLLGDDDEAVEGLNRYIGRTENFVRRFDDHQRKKEFWDRVVLITSKDDAFNEGHWGYSSKRDSSNSPGRPPAARSATTTPRRAEGSRRRRHPTWRRSSASCRSSCRC